MSSPKGSRTGETQIHDKRQRRFIGAQLAERYERGESVREIARDLGRSYCYVYRMLKDAHVQFRDRGGNNDPSVNANTVRRLHWDGSRNHVISIEESE